MKADDGNEYLSKAVRFDSDLTPYGPTNELIAALLGQQLGIPMNSFSLLNFTGGILFGTRWMHTGQFTYCYDPGTLSLCINKEKIYDIFVFDAWICNTDRHHMNLIARAHANPRFQESLILIANDHDRCLMPADVDPFNLDEWWSPLGLSSFSRIPLLRGSIDSNALLSDAIARVESLSHEQIYASLGVIPDQLLKRNERKAISDFLMARTTNIRNLFKQSDGLFKNIDTARL